MAPDMMSFAQFQHSAEHYLTDRDVSRHDFLKLARHGVELARQDPSSRERVAYLLVSVAARTSHITETPLVQQIADRFADLELPDAHVDTRKRTVDELWEDVARLIERVYGKHS
jgi:hypothetical protein